MLFILLLVLFDVTGWTIFSLFYRFTWMFVILDILGILGMLSHDFGLLLWHILLFQLNAFDF